MANPSTKPQAGPFRHTTTEGWGVERRDGGNSREDFAAQGDSGEVTRLLRGKETALPMAESSKHSSMVGKDRSDVVGNTVAMKERRRVSWILT